MVCALFLAMGGPPILFFHGLYLWTLGSWTSAVLHLLLTLFLSMHPLPKADGWLRQTRFALALSPSDSGS